MSKEKKDYEGVIELVTRAFYGKKARVKHVTEDRYQTDKNIHSLIIHIEFEKEKEG